MRSHIVTDRKGFRTRASRALSVVCVWGACWPLTPDRKHSKAGCLDAGGSREPPRADGGAWPQEVTARLDLCQGMWGTDWVLRLHGGGGWLGWGLLLGVCACRGLGSGPDFPCCRLQPALCQGP